MLAPAPPREARGFALRAILLLVLLVGAPWLGRHLLGTITWRELTERTQQRLVELAIALGPLTDPEVGGSADFDQEWGVDYSSGPAEQRTRFTFRAAGAGSPRLAVELRDAVTGPVASIRFDDLGLHRDSLRSLAAGLAEFFEEQGIAFAGIEEREVVRLFSGEEFEVPAGRSLHLVELGLVATGSSSSISAEVVVSVDGENLLTHEFGGTLHASGIHVYVGGDHLAYTFPAARAVLAGESIRLTELSGQKAFALAELGPP